MTEMDGEQHQKKLEKDFQFGRKEAFWSMVRSVSIIVMLVTLWVIGILLAICHF
jgi:hypothetical protein